MSTPESLSPLIVTKSTRHLTLLGSGAVFYNKAGDLYSPMIQRDATTSPLLDASIQSASLISWFGPDCFTPLAQTQHWLRGNAYNGQPDYMSGFLTCRNSGYATVKRFNTGMPTDFISEQTYSKSDLPIRGRRH